ncbi:MAG TPA: type II toxin-antitoxin system VapC family toxin [Terrimesophilobacter sp.]|nr:type II toxin-antitoxin system VapC family toxin [Terrimesophilobacter sp.]HRP98933.1 type II toxin-antitoxin system VapC family toxin [Terrimesophilobacter sp.]
MSGAIVVDCSALYDYMVADISAELSTILAQREWHAPQLIDYEFLAVLRRHVEKGHIPPSDATERLDYFGLLNIERHGIELLRHRVWSLRHNFTTYDASYVTLASALGAPLITTDLRLAREASRYCDVLTP